MTGFEHGVRSIMDCWMRGTGAVGHTRLPRHRCTPELQQAPWGIKAPSEKPLPLCASVAVRDDGGKHLPAGTVRPRGGSGLALRGRVSTGGEEQQLTAGASLCT